jgi:hypothetical protein
VLGSLERLLVLHRRQLHRLLLLRRKREPGRPGSRRLRSAQGYSQPQVATLKKVPGEHLKQVWQMQLYRWPVGQEGMHVWQ